jgi:hypothetical protein
MSHHVRLRTRAPPLNPHNEPPRKERIARTGAVMGEGAADVRARRIKTAKSKTVIKPLSRISWAVDESKKRRYTWV